MNEKNINKESYWLGIVLLLGVVSATTALLFYNIADYDLWHRLIQGASVWIQGKRIITDIFTFTPTLPMYTDHEWLTGTFFYGAIHILGSPGLMLIKILFYGGAISAAVAAARTRGASGQAIAWIAVLAAMAMISGFMNVVRCQVVTILFFSLTVLVLEQARTGKMRLLFVLPALFMLWANMHGGFVAGLIVVAIYVFTAIVRKERVIIWLIAGLSCVIAVMLQPNGLELWKFIFTIATHPQAHNSDWTNAPIWGLDLLTPFRLLFIVCVALVGRIIRLREIVTKLEMWLVILFVTAMALHQYRHATLFAVGMLVFLPALLDESLPVVRRSGKALCLVYALTTALVVSQMGGAVTYYPLAPVGKYPVRPVDILALSKVSGNLAVPLHWGGYVSWRLYPQIKVSADGRNETMYPPETMAMDWDFFAKQGKQWDRLVKKNPVDFVLLDLTNTLLSKEDMHRLGYEIVWDDGYSALYTNKKHLAVLGTTREHLPDTTIDPVDPALAKHWL